MVANAFIPNPNDLPYVNHKDEIKTNNVVSNLERCDPKYNANYGTRNDTLRKQNGRRVGQYALDGSLIKIWDSVHKMYDKRYFDRPDLFAQDILTELNSDGIHYINKVEGVGSNAYGVTNPNYIKLADPIVYDDFGKIIPLS
nr:MAG TPA: PROTEIN/DNA Complex catalytic motif, Helix-turn-helix DNA [Bacteriophage sp.]